MSEVQKLKDVMGNVTAYGVTHVHYVEALVASHLYIALAASAVIGATLWEYIEHAFGLK